MSRSFFTSWALIVVLLLTVLPLDGPGSPEPGREKRRRGPGRAGPSPPLVGSLSGAGRWPRRSRAGSSPSLPLVVPRRLRGNPGALLLLGGRLALGSLSVLGGARLVLRSLVLVLQTLGDDLRPRTALAARAAARRTLLGRLAGLRGVGRRLELLGAPPVVVRHL